MPEYTVLQSFGKDPYFKFNAHVKSIVTRASPSINIRQAFVATNWGQQKETVLITFDKLSLSHFSLIRFIFLYMKLPFGSLMPHQPFFRYSKTLPSA